MCLHDVRASDALSDGQMRRACFKAPLERVAESNDIHNMFGKGIGMLEALVLNPGENM